MEENETLIRQCIEGNPTGAQQTFNQLMMDRIASTIDNQRLEVASHLFTQPQAT